MNGVYGVYLFSFFLFFFACLRSVSC